MRKITRLLAISVALLWAGTTQAGVVTTDQYKFLFDGVLTSTIPTPAITATLYSSTSTSTSMFATASGAAALNLSSNILFSGGGSGNRGSVLYNLNGGAALSTTKKEVVEFDWAPNTTDADAMAYNAIGLSDAAKNPIFVFVDELWSTTNSGLHLMNLTPTALTASPWLLTAPTYATTGNYPADCITAFSSSWLGADFMNNKTYHVKAKLDFSTHMIDSLWVARSDDATKVYTTSALAFMSAAATNADKISAVAVRGKKIDNSGGGVNSVLNMTIDNYRVYTWETAQTTSVIVNYYDADDNSFITSLTRTNQAIAGTYAVTGYDKASFTFGGKYCVYSSILLDNVAITADGLAHVDLKVKRFSATSGTYTWTGVIDGTFNELNANLTTDGVNTVGYQPGNAIAFPDAGLNKSVTMNDNFNLGANDLTVSGDGYTLQGNSTISGTGKLNVNLTGSQAVTLNISNALTGVTQIAGGQITISKTGALGTSAVVNGATNLITSVALPATTFNASSQINPTVASSIAGMTAPTGVKVSATSSIATSSAVSALQFAPTGTFAGELDLNGTAASETRFAMTAASATYLGSAKVSLLGTAFLFIDTNQAAASTISIGTLSGEAGTRLGWGKSSGLDRTITWSVGSLNENSEYAGTITNTGGYNAGGLYYIGSFTNFIKEGTGTLTMSGTANTHNGNFTVNGGNLNVTGTIGNATSVVTVAAAGTLSGTGTIGGATTINGILSGSLNFGSSLTLAGTTNIVVNGFTAGQFDVVNVAGALTYGGALNVTVNGGNPAKGTAIKILNFASQSGTLSQPMTAPANYSFDVTTGTLTYDGLTGVNETGLDGLSIYPTLSHGDITISGVNASSVELVNNSGQTVKQVNLKDGKTTISLTDLTSGAYLVKVKSIDGAVKVQKVIYQK